MTSRARHFTLVAVLAALTGACGRESSTSVTAPSSRCGVNASAQPTSVSAPGGGGAIVVATNRECAWEAHSEADWLSLSGAAGQGDGRVTFAAAANPQVVERRGTVVVNGVRVEITQGAAPCVFTLDRLERAVAASGGRHDVAVSTQNGCAWTAVSQVPWMTIVAGATGQGSGVVGVLVQANETADRRTGTLTIAGQTYTVEQASSPVPIPPSDPDCTFVVEPQIGQFGSEGGIGDVAVSASASRCAWAAASAVPWIRIEGSANETGSGRLRYVVAPNTGPARAGTLIVAGTVITVNQGAPGTPPPTPCTFTIAPTTASFAADGGSSEVVVTASAPTCAWTAQPSVSWIAIQGASGGTGSGRLRFAVAVNTATVARSGALVVAGSTVGISQAAASPTPPTPDPCTITVAPTAASFPSAGGTADVVVTASAATCAWTASAGVPWITFQGSAGGTGSGRLTYVVAGQTGTTDRTGTFVVAGTTVTVTEAAAPAGPDPCTFTIAPNAAAFAAAGGNGDITVTASASTCTWTAASAAPWLAIQGAAGGTGSGHLTYTVASYSGGTDRVGTLTVAGFAATITQTPPPPPDPCTFSIAPSAATFAAAGGAGEIVVTASASTCTWTATSAAPWITIQGAAGGTGSGRLAYAVANHTGATDRAGALTVAGFTATITQTAPPPPCTFTVTPLELTVGLLGAINLEVHVETGATCAWTAASQANWVTINGAASGTGSGSIRVSVAASLLTGRTGTLVVAGQTVTVTQTGLLGARENKD
jgi:hypothetical protein